MRLPQINYKPGAVQSLGRENPQAAAQVELAKGKVLQTLGKKGEQVADHVLLLKEQDKALELRNEALEDMNTLNQAINPKTGMVDINMLPDEDRTSYLTNPNYDQKMDVNDGDKRLVPFHKLGPEVMQRFTDREAKRSGVPTTRRGQELYRKRDKGTTKDFGNRLLAISEASAIRTTVNNSMKAIELASDNFSIDKVGSITEINDTLEFLEKSGYKGAPQVAALRSKVFAKLGEDVNLEQISIMKEGADAAFNGDKQALKNADDRFNENIKLLRSYGDELLPEKHIVKLEQNYNLQKQTEVELAEVEHIYDNQGNQAALDHLHVVEREKPKDGLDQFQQDKLVDEVRARYRRLHSDKTAQQGAGRKLLDQEVRDYVARRGIGEPVNNEEAAALYNRVAAYTDNPKLLEMIQQADRRAIFAQSNYDERQEMLKQYSTGDMETLKYTGELDQMKKTESKINQELKSDAMGYAVKTGVVPDIELDLDSPVLSINKMRDRQAKASEWFKYPVPLFTEKQADALMGKMDTMDPNTQVAIIQGIADTNDSTAADTFSQLSKDKTGIYGAAGGLILEGANPKSLLIGYRRLKNGWNMPTKTTKGNSVDVELGLMGLDEVYSGPKHQQVMNEAIKAQVAYLMDGQTTERLDTEILEQAAKFVSGGYFAIEANGKENFIEAPYRGATKDDWTNGLKRTTASDIEKMGLPANIPAQRLVERIHAGDVKFKSVGQGQYTISINGDQIGYEEYPNRAYVFDFDVLRGDSNYDSWLEGDE